MFIPEYLTYFVEYIMGDTFAQGVGFIAMIVLLIAFLQKDDYTVMKLLLLSIFFWGVHFYLMGVMSGLAASSLAAMRILLSFKYKKNITIFWCIIILTCIAGYFSYDGFISLFPIIASLLGTYAFFYLEKIQLRIVLICMSGLWLVHNSYIGSISGTISEILVQFMLIFTIYRMLYPVSGMNYYTQKMKDILWRTRHPDYDRYIFLHDKIITFRKKTGQHFLQVLHLDLKKSILKRKWTICSRFLHSQKDQ